MGEHTPTPWEYRDVFGAGLEICAPVYQVSGVELPVGMPSAPIQTFILTGPQIVQVAAERWVQFEPKGWHEMQEANAAFIVKACNAHADLVKALEEISQIKGSADKIACLHAISFAANTAREALAKAATS